MQASEGLDRKPAANPPGRVIKDQSRSKSREGWRSIPVKLFGMRGALIHWDTTVLDRWLWVSHRLPRNGQGQLLCDVGCGTGTFTIGAAQRGYTAVGLSWDERNQRVAAERAAMCGATTSSFEVLDVRRLDSRADFRGLFDVIVCAEVIEHIADDGKLMRDMAACLKPGGRLLLTTPYEHYRAITPSDEGPFIMDRQDGWHVRRGYTETRLRELCQNAGLAVDEFSYCSGILSQKITYLLRVLARIHRLVGLAAILPLRVLPPLFDRWLTTSLRWPFYSICLEAHRPKSN
jgi:SAM-dependent methyltransferase